jgi:4-hydroxymandelate oxidase
MLPVNLSEYEVEARRRLPSDVWDYFAGGAEDERTLRDNVEAYARLRLNQRVLRGVATPDLRCAALGTELAQPIVIAPAAFQRLAHGEGEVATARAVSAAGSLLMLSTLATAPIEDVVRSAGTAPVWLQLYVYRDTALTEALIARAEAAGCKALVLTVDVPAWAKRERDLRNAFALGPGIAPVNVAPFATAGLAAGDGSALANYITTQFKFDLGWTDVARLASRTRLPLWLKGVMHPSDARRALEHGVAGIVVSNHGGRQLDGALASIDALPAIAEAVDGALPLLLDGGIRRGSDVLKALARGASAVAIGRPALWGLAHDGAAGVERVLAILRDELSIAMALTGCASLADVTDDVLA